MVGRFAGAHVIDMNDVMRRELYETKSKPTLIYKIHLSIREKYKKDYEPSNLSIGPYHHGTPSLGAMEKVKWGYLNYFLELNHEKKLQDYIKAISKLEKQTRSRYSDEIKMDKKSFLEMLLLDGCFILMAFNGMDGAGPDYNTSIEGSQMIMNENNDYSYDIDEFYNKVLIRDMLLLENQIPFFVITKIYEIVTGGRSQVSLLVKNIIRTMNYVFDYNPKAIQKSDGPQEIHHLLHLFQMYFKPSEREEEENFQNHVMRPLSFYNYSKIYEHNKYEAVIVRRVKQYHEARIELKKRDLSCVTPHSLLDIRFLNGTLEIPYLNIDAENCTLFRNLIAFEQTCPQIGNYITTYVVFWSQFIAEPDDVTLLSEKGIIRHGLNRDSEVIDIFKSLANCISFDLNGDNYLKSLCRKMEAHYQIRRCRWREWFSSIKSKISELPTKLS